MPPIPNALRRSAPRPRARSLQNLRLLQLGLLLTALSVGVSAQEPNQDDVIRVRTDLVTVPAIVTDKSGHRVSGLTQDDFLLRDAGQSVKLDHFSVGTDHVALVFLLDASGSSREYIARQREAALALFSRFGPGSEVAVMRFVESAKVAVPFTHDTAAARRGFDFPVAFGGHTAIFDAADSAIQLIEQRKSDPVERRIIILTSDGLDTSSSTRSIDLIYRAGADGISFYIIHFPLFSPSGGHLEIRPPAKGFRELAEKTGGRYFIAGDVKLALDPNARYDLAAVFKAIEVDLASQYLLGFYPGQTEKQPGWHRLEVEMKTNQRRYRVKTLRDGYSLK